MNSSPALGRQLLTSPFNPERPDAYQDWRSWKMYNYPQSLSDLVLAIADPRQLTELEYAALTRLCAKTNMALYISDTVGDPDKQIPLALGTQLGLGLPDRNWLGDVEGVTSLTVREEGERRHYIPYTRRPIQWHTDGYYNSGSKQIKSLLLHCVDRADHGGENELLDHEIAYILVRDENPEFITALMAPDALTIPARVDESGVARAEETGPVFSVDPVTGDLHMRYTARSRSIQWKDNAVTSEAVACLSDVLANSPGVFRGRLEPGMGLVSNNVLHTRTGFEDGDEHRRLIYRARYYSRIAGTSRNDSEIE